MKRKALAHERIFEGPCFCPSCGKDFRARVILGYNTAPVWPECIICEDCQNSPLAQGIDRVLRQYGKR